MYVILDYTHVQKHTMCVQKAVRKVFKETKSFAFKNP